MSPLPEYMAMESEYQVDRRSHEKMPAPQHRSSTRPSRTTSRPKSFNGIHRRKSKKINW